MKETIKSIKKNWKIVAIIVGTCAAALGAIYYFFTPEKDENGDDEEEMEGAKQPSTDEEANAASDIKIELPDRFEDACVGLAQSVLSEKDFAKLSSGQLSDEEVDKLVYKVMESPDTDKIIESLVTDKIIESLADEVIRNDDDDDEEE